MSRKVSKQELVEDYERVAADIGDVPTKTEYNEYGEYSETVIYNHFDSMSQLKVEAGFDADNTKVDTQDLVADLHRVAEKIGRTPPIEEYKEHGDYSSKTFKRRFGNWSQVLARCGFEPTEHSQHWADNEPAQVGTQYGTVTVKCDYCSSPVERTPYALRQSERIYCDSQCQGAHMAEQSGPDTNAWEGGKVEYECEQCGETAEVVPARAEEARFCSYECVGKHHQQVRSGEDSPRWRGGYKPYYGPNWREQRRRARERDDYECQICGMTEAEHKDEWNCTLPVHHIKRFGSFDSYEQANQLPNLITLCRPHHSAVESGDAEIPEERKAQFEACFSAA